MEDWRQLGPGLVFVALLVGMFILSRIGKLMPARNQRPAFAPDPRNDKSIIVAGWTEQELNRMLRDFVKMYELSTTFEPKSVPQRRSTFRISFPDDLAPDHFLFLVNYLNYPTRVIAKDRAIGVIGRTTLTSQFDVPDESLIGRHAEVNVPANDQEYDQVDIRLQSGPVYRWRFSSSTWQRLDHADVPSAINGL